ncbi:MAG: class I SAM-dependent methyltransferase [Chloroflexota bacterium]
MAPDEAGDPTGKLTCRQCSGTYVVSEGVATLIPLDAYRRFPIRKVQDVYDRAYGHPGIMGTQFDPEYSRVTKTALLEFCHGAPNARILDIGTGDGDLWTFTPDANNGYAIDISEVGVRRARGRFPSLHAAVAVSEWLPYPNEFFGSVIAADTLEHAFDLVQSLRAIKRVLAADGTLACSVPAPDSLRKWGYNRMLRGVPSLRFALRLARVVLLRAFLFGKPNFQPLDRDLSLDGWRQVLDEAGFRIVTLREWPAPPLKPIVYLVSAKVAS